MKDEAPCLECLKYSICLGKGTVECEDLVKWLQIFNGGATRIIQFETDVWNKDIAIIDTKDYSIRFKDTIRDQYSCLITR
jgi:hypothetical protein